MKLTLPRQSLLTALERIVPFVKTGVSVVPSLGWLKLDCAETSLSATVNDLESCASSRTDAEVVEPGSLCVTANQFYKFLKLFPGEKVSLESDGRKLSCDCGDNQVFLVATFEASEFPPFDPIDEGGFASVNGEDLARLIRMALPCVPSDTSRPSLHGVAFEGDGTNLSVRATDGHKLFSGSIPCEANGQALILNDALERLASLATEETDLRMSIQEKRVVWLSNSWRVGMQKSVGAMISFDLPFERVKNPMATLVVNRDQLLEALAAACLASAQEYLAARLTVNGSVILENHRTVSDPSIYCAFKRSLTPEIVTGKAEFRFNPAYLQQQVRSLKSDVVTIRIAEQAATISTEDRSFTFLLAGLYR